MLKGTLFWTLCWVQTLLFFPGIVGIFAPQMMISNLLTSHGLAAVNELVLDFVRLYAFVLTAHGVSSFLVRNAEPGSLQYQHRLISVLCYNLLCAVVWLRLFLEPDRWLQSSSIFSLGCCFLFSACALFLLRGDEPLPGTRR